MKYDYNLKAQIIDCGLAKIQSLFSKYCFLFDKCYHDTNATYLGLTNEASLELLDARLHSLEEEALKRFNVNLCDPLDPLVREALRINRASYLRVKRLKDKINKLLEKPCVFLTLTFNNDALNSTSDLTKRRYVSRCLKTLHVPYIANVDYGKKNERIHFHAIAQIDKINFNIWEYGNIDAKKIITFNGVAISKYLNKLTNHAIKETCKCNRLIYSKRI